MATVTLFVNTGSTSGGDGTTNATSGGNRAYPSVAAALTGINGGAAATGDDITILCCAEDVGSGNAQDSSAVNINSTNLSAVTPGSLTIAANSGHVAGKYNGNALISTAHYRLSVSSGSCISIAKDVGNVTIDGLQLECSAGAFRAGIALSVQAARTYNFNNNRVRLSSATRLGIGMPGTPVSTDGQTINIINNIISGADTAAIELWNNSFRAPTWNIYHNTLYGDGSSNLLKFDLLGSATLNIKNNCGWNSGTSTEIAITNSQTPTLNYDTNAFQDGNGTTNEITLTSSAATWVSAGTGQSADFTPATGSQLLDVGVTGLSITTDINGTTRDSPPDIGAVEVAAGGGGTDASVNLTGVGGTGSAGTLAATVSLILPAVTATGSVGTLTVKLDSTATLTGVAGTGAVGTLTALSGTVITITGVAGTGSVGTLSARISDSITLTGVSATGQVGTLTVQVPADVSVNLTGVSATGGVGDLSVSFDATWTPVSPAGGTWTAVIPGSAIWTPQ